jgi:hypothetical protein
MPNSNPSVTQNFAGLAGDVGDDFKFDEYLKSLLADAPVAFARNLQTAPKGPNGSEQSPMSPPQVDASFPFYGTNPLNSPGGY